MVTAQSGTEYPRRPEGPGGYCRVRLGLGAGPSRLCMALRVLVGSSRPAVTRRPFAAPAPCPLAPASSPGDTAFAVGPEGPLPRPPPLATGTAGRSGG